MVNTTLSIARTGDWCAINAEMGNLLQAYLHKIIGERPDEYHLFDQLHYRGDYIHPLVVVYRKGQDMKNIQQGMVMTDADGDSDTVLDDLSQVVPGTVVTLHNNMIDALRKAYPKWKDTWLIRIDTRGGIVQVYNTAFSGEMGFVMHITKIDPEMRKVVTMAGELFERYGIARGRGMAINQALADLKRDKIGRVLHED